jgi:hypothetical protein
MVVPQVGSGVGHSREWQGTENRVAAGPESSARSVAATVAVVAADGLLSRQALPQLPCFSYPTRRCCSQSMRSED